MPMAILHIVYFVVFLTPVTLAIGGGGDRSVDNLTCFFFVLVVQTNFLTIIWYYSS